MVFCVFVCVPCVGLAYHLVKFAHCYKVKKRHCWYLRLAEGKRLQTGIGRVSSERSSVETFAVST